MLFCGVVDYEWTIRDVAWPRTPNCQKLRQSTLCTAVASMLLASS